MKNLIFLAVFLLVFSCTNHAPLDKEMSEVTMFKEVSMKKVLENKFKELYDLNLLKKKFPEFKNDIDRRIQNFTFNHEVNFEFQDSIRISNIRQKGGLIKISDSVQMAKVVFDLTSQNSTKTDSVFAFITKKEAIIDSEKVFLTKVQFSRKE